MLIDHHLARLGGRALIATHRCLPVHREQVHAIHRRCEATPPRIDAALRSMRNATGATALTADELRGLLAKLATSQYCRDHDLVGPITMLIATGLRRSEMLGLRWADYDAEAAEITVKGRVVRLAVRDWCGRSRRKAGPPDLLPREDSNLQPFG
jgi:integrase